MFCVPSKNKFNMKLEKNNIYHINKMKIFGLFVNNIKNWNFIETHMI